MVVFCIEIWQSSVWYTRSLGWWDDRLIYQASAVPSKYRCFFTISCKILWDETIDPATQHSTMKIIRFLVFNLVCSFMTEFLCWSCWVGWSRNQLSLFYTKFLWTKRLLACLASSLDASHACCMGDPNMFQHLDTLKTPFFKVLIIIGLVLLFTPRSFCRLGTLLYFFTVYHSIYIRTVSLKLLLSTLLIQFRLVYGHFGQRNKHVTIDFCLRLAGRRWIF